MTKYILELHWEKMPHPPFSADIAFLQLTYIQKFENPREVVKNKLFFNFKSKP